MAESFVLILCLCMVSLFFISQADDLNDDHSINAISYDGDTFGPGLAKKRNFIMFYAPWCGHCKNLAPTWDELAKIYNNAEESPVVIAKVDCTVHTGLCADHDVVGFPTLKLFEANGETHKRYSGKRDLESLKAFIQEQIQGLGSETDIAAEKEEELERHEEPESNVITLTDEDYAGKIAAGFFFIKFYAPWCGHCKRLAPVWEELANAFSKDENVFIAKIDCTQSTVVCKAYEIRGYPTLLWFKDGQKIDQFQAPRSIEVLTKFVQDKLTVEKGEQHGHDSEKVPEEIKEDSAGGAVVELTEENFKTIIASGLVFIKFYAPWCGHCKRLAPTWDDLARESSGQPVVIAKVDCTQYKNVCEENEIRGYPTLKIFRNGELLNDYRGGRTLEDLQKFVSRQLDQRDEL
ncbi:unnamed protein product [Lymnaea stagnalis]|uniref:Thioredoxin domain-containing protein n=1 Tax=Lymnaea stagnalis TaxID=6523 RepID=A0AAV2HVX7_LYMST